MICVFSTTQRRQEEKREIKGMQLVMKQYSRLQKKSSRLFDVVGEKYVKTAPDVLDVYKSDESLAPSYWRTPYVGQLPTNTAGVAEIQLPYHAGPTCAGIAVDDHLAEEQQVVRSYLAHSRTQNQARTPRIASGKSWRRKQYRRSAPRCNASRNTVSAEAGPMLTATTSAAVSRFKSSAICKAYKSSGFVRLNAEERFNVFVTGLSSTLVD